MDDNNTMNPTPATPTPASDAGQPAMPPATDMPATDTTNPMPPTDMPTGQTNQNDGGESQPGQ